MNKLFNKKLIQTKNLKFIIIQICNLMYEEKYCDQEFYLAMLRVELMIYFSYKLNCRKYHLLLSLSLSLSLIISKSLTFYSHLSIINSHFISYWSHFFFSLLVKISYNTSSICMFFMQY